MVVDAASDEMTSTLVFGLGCGICRTSLQRELIFANDSFLCKLPYSRRSLAILVKLTQKVKPRKCSRTHARLGSIGA